MSVDAVIGAWLDQVKETLDSGNMRFKGRVIISFRTPIAYLYDDIVLMTVRYHSATTSRHKRRIIEKAKERGLLVVEAAHINPQLEQEHASNVHHLKAVLEQARGHAARYSGQNYSDYYQKMADDAQQALELYEHTFQLCPT